MSGNKFEEIARDLRDGLPADWQRAGAIIFFELWTPAESAWSGLAREILMWLDMYSGGDKTPRNLFLHLERCGLAIPDWLRNEPEMRALDHVPSKGTRAVIIYRAVLDGLRNIERESRK